MCRVATVRENISFQGQGKVWELCIKSEKSKFYLKVSEKSENFTFGGPFDFGRRFSISKGNVVSKNPSAVQDVAYYTLLCSL